MIKRTLYFSNPAYLKKHNDQMIVELPETETTTTIPIEDIGLILLDNPQITLTHGLLQELIANNCAIITCDSKRMPSALLMPLCGNTLQNERFRTQIKASEPLRKQMWQQTVKAKIANQAANLKEMGLDTENMEYWQNEVKSGDTNNYEARAAAWYWQHFFPEIENFTRDREGIPPNNLLNYGYAILRAVIARSLVGAGLLPTLGIHHQNRYNAFCLADDIMEPYRPYVDKIVKQIVVSGEPFKELTRELKAKLLQIPVLEVVIDGQRSPLMIAARSTAASVNDCFEGTLRKIEYPVNG